MSGQKLSYACGFLPLTGAVSLCMSAAEWYTARLGWDPGPETWRGPGAVLLYPSDAAWIFLLAAVNFSVLCFAVPRLSGIRPFTNHEVTEFSRRSFFLSALFLFAAWMPFFLAFYPGTGMNDTTYIMDTGIEASWLHPLLYVLYLSGIGEISWEAAGSYEFGLAANSLIQMACMAAALSWTAGWLYRKTRSRVAFAVCMAYYAFTPIIANYSFTGVKDVFFSLILLLWCPFLYQVQTGSGRPLTDYRVPFLLLSLGMLLLRNNGTYMYGVLFLALIFAWRRREGRAGLIRDGALCLAAAVLVQGISTFCTGIYPPFQEKAAIPIQQLGRAAAAGVSFRPKEKEYMESMFLEGGFASAYDPFQADGIKWNPNFLRMELYNHPEEFLSVWKTVGERNLRLYAEAWMLETYGVWSFPAMDADRQARFVSAFSAYDAEFGMQPSENFAFRPGKILRIYPEKLQEALSDYLYRTSYFLSGGTCFWIMEMAALLLVFRRRYSLLLPLLPAFLCWGTLMMATPGALIFRYVFYFPLCLPFFLLLPLLEEREGKPGIWMKKEADRGNETGI